MISGNYVGTANDGMSAADPSAVGSCSSAARGIHLLGQISGAEISGNLVSGVRGQGISLSPAAGASGDVGPQDSVIKGNIVGLDRDGNAAVANQCSGVELSATLHTGALDRSMTRSPGPRSAATPTRLLAASATATAT